MAGAAAVARRRALARRLPALPVPPPWLRRLLLALAALGLLLLAGYRLWLRDSALVGVERVAVTGLTTRDAERLRTALVSTARTMTTLNVDPERLEEVTAGYPAVRGLEVDTDFPNALRIRVLEHRPIAMALGAGGRVPVAGDGTVLRALPVEHPLPTIRAAGGMRGDRLAGRLARASARVAATAPEALRRRVGEVEREPERGLVARVRDGPELAFGGTRALRAKWAAAARVLADPEAAGAAYVDLRVPGRPAVGTVASDTAGP